MTSHRDVLLFVALATSALGLGLGWYGYLTGNLLCSMIGLMPMQVLSLAKLQILLSAPDHS